MYNNQGKLKPEYRFFNTKVAIEKYSNAIDDVGLWQSEKIIVSQYCKKKNFLILDVGCGAGRSTFGLYRLGYRNIVGIDISDKLICCAHDYMEKNNIDIDFYNYDAEHLPFADGIFQFVLFSYNGLTGIPTERRRLKVLEEIYRVMQSGAYFVFCAHDREQEKENKIFWIKEQQRWETGRQNPALYEYGDTLFPVDNCGNYEFLHYYNCEEMIMFLKKTKFTIINTMARKDICEESIAVNRFSKETRFWILRKD